MGTPSPTPTPIPIFSVDPSDAEPDESPDSGDVGDEASVVWLPEEVVCELLDDEVRVGELEPVLDVKRLSVGVVI